MAAVANKAQNYPFFLGYVSPYIENKNVRYPLYVLSVLAVAAAALQYGNTKVGITLASAGCFAQGYQIVQLSREIKNTPMDEETRNRKISRITDRVFTMGLIWGIVMSGLNLSLIYYEGSLLLHGADLSLLKTPTAIPYAWLQNAPTLIYHTTNLASIGCFAIPQAYSYIVYGDGLFFGTKQYAQQVHALCTKLLNVWIAVKEETTLTSLPQLFMDLLQASDLWSYLYGAFGEASPQAILMWNAFKNFLAMLVSQEFSCKALNEWITSFSNPEPNRLFPRAEKRNPRAWETTKYIANYLFFHTLNISIMAARLYYHRFPTAIYFGVGLLYPTTFQKEMTIRRTWEVAPDFIGMPLVIKCRYLFERLSSAGTSLAWWNIPGA
ncbi:MAG TPA: hypothetical protein VIJ14_08640, partial [Rhabdochlamydiaceae bacterium]